MSDDPKPYDNRLIFFVAAIIGVLAAVLAIDHFYWSTPQPAYVPPAVERNEP